MRLQSLDEMKIEDRGDRGDRVLLDTRERREQERRLREIQQQLQVLHETDPSNVSSDANKTQEHLKVSGLGARVLFYLVS